MAKSLYGGEAMTTNQTIDGVPGLRELLGRIANPYRREPRSIHLHNADIAELRALLDAPIEETLLEAFSRHARQFTFKNHPALPAMFPMGYPWFKAGYEAGKAAQPQGEPVAYADPKSFENFKNLAHLGGLYAHEWMWATPAPGLVPLYAGQPAPVAVASRDESIYWLKRIDGIGQARAELIYSMGFRRHTEVPQS